MPVEDGFEQMAPPVSPLLAMGTGPRFNRRWLIGIGIGVSLLVGLILFTLLCSAQFFLPEQTLFLATASPKSLNSLLTPEQQATLPIEWQQTIAAQSGWPVVFGLAGSRTKLEAFTIGPRWSVPKAQDLAQMTRALIRQSGAVESSTQPHSTSSESLTYRETFFDHLFGQGVVRGSAALSPIFPNSSSSNRILFFVDQGQLVLSDTTNILSSSATLNAEPSATAKPLQTDLSLHLSALSNTSNIEGFLAELPIEPLSTTLSSLTDAPATLELQLTSSTIQAVRLTFREALTGNERAALQTVLDQSPKKRLFGLPDGSLVNEFFVPMMDPSNTTSTTDPKLFEWRLPEQPALPQAMACGKGVWIARFSSELLNQFTSLSSRLRPWLPQTALQVWRDGGHLIICEEG